MKNQTKSFLTAEWRKLLMFNYEISPEIIKPYIPLGTEIDFHESKTYASVVGFMFLNTKVLGIKIPFHVHFEEVNLRIYVKRIWQDEIRRGVVFIKEIVPKLAIAKVANWMYQEHYQALPMRHTIQENISHLQVEYAWKHQQQWNHIQVKAANQTISIPSNSLEEFITEHYWGYTKGKKNTVEYQVTHPRWEIYPVEEFALKVDFENVYPRQFAFLAQQTPNSVLLAEGSEISVKKPQFLYL